MKDTTSIDFLKEGTVVLVANALDKIVAFGAFIYFAHYFLPSSFGAAYAVIGVSVLLGSVPNALANSIRKRVSEISESHGAYFVIGVSAICTTTVLASIALTILLEQFMLRYEWLAVPGIVHFASRSYLYLVQQIQEGTGYIGKASVVEFADGLVTVVTKFALILGLGMGSEGLIYGSAIGALVTGTATYLRTYDEVLSIPNLEQLRSLLEFFRWNVIARIAYVGYSRSETALVGFFIGPVSASYIKSAKTLSEPSQLPMRSLESSVFVEVSSRSARGQAFTDTIRKGVRYAGLFSLPMLFGVLLLNERLMVAVFGSEYAGSGVVLVAVSIAAVFQSYSSVLKAALNGADNPRLVAILNAGQGVLFVPVYVAVLLVDDFLLFVAVFAFSYVFELIVTVLVTRYRVLKSGFVDWWFILDQLLASMGMAAVLYVAVGTLRPTSITAVTSVVLLGAVAYLAILTAISSRFRRRSREAFVRGIDFVGYGRFLRE